MSLVAIVPLVAALVGLLVYALSANGKVAELGRIAFSCGLLVTLFVFAHSNFSLGK